MVSSQSDLQWMAKCFPLKVPRLADAIVIGDRLSLRSGTSGVVTDAVQPVISRTLYLQFPPCHLPLEKQLLTHPRRWPPG